MASPASAADIVVPAGGNLQAAIDTAQAGDVILLKPGAVYVGNFTLPAHAGTAYITIRSAASDTQLPPAGTRITPAAAPLLPVIKSPNDEAAMRTAAGAAYWRLMFLEFRANVGGYGNILDLGDGSDSQFDLSQVPHHLIVDRVYIHGDAGYGQKRNIGLNSGTTSILNSYISDAKAIDQDSQAIAGWNGPGPYLIENNYIEGAGNGILLGGDDPKIPGLTPSGLTFRGNTVTKPLSWRTPVTATPTGLRATGTADGKLAQGAYAYRVVARRQIGDGDAYSAASAEVSITVVANGRVTLNWDPVPGAVDYLVYGRKAGAQKIYWRVTAPTFSDSGAAGTAGTPQPGTTWQVKNLFELKNFNDARVVDNVMENVWEQAQSGFAILLTPRNQNGGCTWCGVSNVVLERNTVRHMGGGIQILGWDDEHPSQQTHTIVIRNNEFSDIDSSVWGGDGYFVQVTDGPRNVTVDHNTIISPSGSGVLTVGGMTAEQFVFTNNVARHNDYGIQGTDWGVGNGPIGFYLPGSVIARNVFAGGDPSEYPAGNEFPTVADFQKHFVNYASGNYALVPGTDWERSGTDGFDLGANVGANVTQPQLLQMTTTTLPAAIELESYSTSLAATGGLKPLRWSVTAGTLPAGIVLDPASGIVSGVAQLRGDYTVTIQVKDAAGTTASRNLGVHVDAAIVPVSITTAALPAAVSNVAYMQRLDATGGSGAFTWRAAGGRLPAGLALSTSGAIAGTTTEVGSTTFTVTAVDNADSSRLASRTFVITVAAPVNKLPTVSMSAPSNAAIVPVGATITLAAQAADSDGQVQRVEFYQGGALIGSSAGPGFTMPWLVPAQGSYTFSAVAVDDRNGRTQSAAVTISTRSEVVIYGSQATRLVGNYRIVADAAAAGGYALSNPNKAAAKVVAAAAAPASYAEFTFFAEANRPYHLWVRGRAEYNDYSNDSAFIQFDNVARSRIGTTASLSVNLEDGTSAGVKGYGWQDDGYGIGVLGTAVTFEKTGVQTIRVQPREDGFVIDQIVLSPSKYLTASPGALKSDTTILPQ